MKIPELGYSLEPRLIKKLDLMADRCEREHPKKDAFIICEGNEGEGKTTISCECAKYISYKTGRPFSNVNIFFSAEKMLQFAQQTEKQILIYDEPALDMLSAEWWKKEQQDLKKLFMMGRSKRHFYIINITRFNKFPEDLMVSRALGMIHVYSRKGIQMGRFVYIRQKFLEALWKDFRSKRIRSYKKYSSFHGSFPDALDKIIDMKEYDKCKDDAIMSIGKVKLKPPRIESESKIKLKELRLKIAKLKMPILNREDLSNRLGINSGRLREWINYNPNNPDLDTPLD